MSGRDYDFFSNAQFDKTRIKSLAEKPVFNVNDKDGSLSNLSDPSCFKVK